MMRRIVHPTDFSSASRPAFATAVRLARAGGGRLILVHVLPPLPLLPDVYLAATTFDAMQRAQRQGARRRLDRLAARAAKAGVRATGAVMDFGPAADQIVRAARRARADLIVMGTHGHTGVARVFLGSVAARVLAGAPCPVLTVRGR